MNPDQIKKILEEVVSASLSVEQAMTRLKNLPYEDLGFARLDHHREFRTGVPEIVFGEKKDFSQIAAIVRRMTERGGTILVSRLDTDKGRALMREFPEGRYHPEARIFSLVARQEIPPSPLCQRGAKGGFEEKRGKITIVSAGTSDLSVAEEARVTAEALGNTVGRLYDVGVAGLHRLLPEVPRLREATALIVVAGMEGALPSVVAGLVGRPVIAVPTSVGYGASFGGVTALLAMLNSCVPGVTVVNIDNGVGAAVAAHLICCPSPRPSPTGGEGVPSPLVGEG